MGDTMTDLHGIEQEYTGRFIILGRHAHSDLGYAIYGITGRSPSSQARRLVFDEAAQRVSVQVTDEEQLRKGNRALLVYDAVINDGHGNLLVSNGAQTNLIAEHTRSMTGHREHLTDKVLRYPGAILSAALHKPYMMSGTDIDLTSYEPDAPNFTPRISGVLNSEGFALAVVRKASVTRKGVKLYSDALELNPGEGIGTRTYDGTDENPLAPFDKGFFSAKMGNRDAASMAADAYETLGHKAPSGKDYRVSVAAVLFDRNAGRIVEHAIVNRFQ